MMNKNIGIYIHVPYCNGKCPYCDFYSICDNSTAELYTKAAVDSLYSYSKIYKKHADTLYFGGGTPTLLASENIGKIVNAARDTFSIDACGEITCETNPARNDERMYKELINAGVNRLSMGVQSGVDEELRALGRRHTVQDAKNAVLTAKRCGFKNISLDLMLAVPGQTEKSLCESIDFCAFLEPQHISAYILKIEPATPFGKKPPEIPCDERSADFYLQAVERLEGFGYKQYEISNFAVSGYESRHNLKYWNCDEYLGIGAAAHSFIDGERFFYPRDIDAFLRGESPTPDGRGGDFTEYAMLRLRLCDGLNGDETRERFAHPIPCGMVSQARELEKHGLLRCTDEKIALTKKGFLVSNEIICRLLEKI